MWHCEDHLHLFEAQVGTTPRAAANSCSRRALAAVSANLLGNYRIEARLLRPRRKEIEKKGHVCKQVL